MIVFYTSITSALAEVSLNYFFILKYFIYCLTAAKSVDISLIHMKPLCKKVDHIAQNGLKLNMIEKFSKDCQY
jgi:hypothetical protein